MADKELDSNTVRNVGNCSGCSQEIEVMFPYIIVIVNNTEEPEQTTFRFDKVECLLKWSMENQEWLNGSHPFIAPTRAGEKQPEESPTGQLK